MDTSESGKASLCVTFSVQFAPLLEATKISDKLQASFQSFIWSGQQYQYDFFHVMILLMDPSQHVYELMQIWV